MNKVFPDTPAYPELFKPFALAGKPLKNRIVHAAILTALAQKGRVTDKLVNYYSNRAKGGAAMIVTEPVGALTRHQSSARVCAWDDSELSGLARLADSVERHDCRILAQIQDPGRARHVGGRLKDAIGASPVADDLSWSMPSELSISGIEEVIASFAQTATRLHRCGYSGIEISAGHGHLWHQFLSPWSNLREDRYGGELTNRVRILDELVDAIRFNRLTFHHWYEVTRRRRRQGWHRPRRILPHSRALCASRKHSLFVPNSGITRPLP